MGSWFAHIKNLCSRVFKTALIGLVRFYQLALSPLMANHCRFEPTCSRYAIVAIERHGVFKGGWMALRRIGRCRPGVVGGWDPVPERHAADCACAEPLPKDSEENIPDASNVPNIH